MRRRSYDRLRLALATIGLLIAGYLTLLHYDTSVPLVCAAGAYVDCETVLSSASSTVLGVPVAEWGLMWFAVAGTLAMLSLRSARVAEPAALRNAAFAWCLTGTGGVLWLVYQEVGVIGKLCAWCTAVHVLILALLVVQVVSDPRRGSISPANEI